MAVDFQLYTAFCVILLSAKADVLNQPQLYVENNNLHFEIPDKSYIQFTTQQIKVNDVDLLPTLLGVQNATRFLQSSEAFRAQMYSKMSDIENRISSLGNSPGNSTTNNTAGLININIRVRRLTNRIIALNKNLQLLKQLLTKDECSSNSCQNGGTCIDIFNGFLCQCPSGWEGPTCQTDINECARFVGTDLGCQNGGTCLNLPGTYQCQCTRGWIGIHCNRKPSDCNSGGSEICGHGTCIPQNNEIGYKCLCDSGWTTDGTHMTCSIDVDECKQNHPPCSTNPLVQCINLPGSFMCQHCPPGYTGNGYYCADINECDLFNGGCSVSPFVQCINTPGGSNCGLCPAGYEGDGKKCTFKGVCNVNNGGCSILATCVNNPAISETYVQCTCAAGYTGSGIGPGGCVKTTSNAIMTCTPNPCVHGDCMISAEGVKCICNRQYTGTYCDQIINPCIRNPCINGGTCMPVSNRFVCSCTNGFTGRFCQKERRACGDSFNLPNGTIEYPLSGLTVVRGTERLSCAWTITVEENKVIEVTFAKFKLAATPCTSQWLQVHDGINSLAPALGRFCGNTLPMNGSLTTTHNVIYLWLKTDGQSSKQPEFQLSWTTKDPACGKTLSTEGIGMIVSPGWPNNYPNNRECYWRFSVPVGKRLLFHVYTLNIGQDSDCSEDFLQFYSEKRTISQFVRRVSLQIFFKLCNSTIPEPFYSPYSSGYVYFKSNDRNNYGGFQIGYSVVDGIPGCGGTYTNTDGYIQSIEVTSSMPMPLLCAYEIKLPANSTIRIEIVEIDLDPYCDETNVAIYVVSSGNTNLIGKYCGNELIGPLVTYGNHILIKSQSKYHHKNHWKIKYQAVCRQTYTEPTDTIDVDSQWKECIYLIEQPPGRIIMLDMELTGRFGVFRRYYVEVRDGDNEKATLIGRYRVKGQKIALQSSANYLLIKATASYGYLPKFIANYTTLDLGCGGLLKNDLGTISYPPQGAERYSANKKCKWVIMAPPNKVIQLTWMTFNLEQSFDCSYDNVQVFDNNTESGLGGLLGKFCGYTLPPLMLSSSNIMTLQFTSDNSIHGDGFMVSYTFIKESNVCGGNYFTPAGVIKSPGYPKNYPTNRECVWTITVPPGNQIMLKFINFSLESYSNCRYDWVEVRNGGTSSSPLVGRYCGTTYPKTIPSHTNKLYVKFNSDMSKTDLGFKIEWSSTATGCGGTLSSPSGSIISPHYPEPYTKNTDCLWKITISAGSKIQLIFADIDLEKHRQCGLDYVQLFDGPTINSPSLGKFCTQQTSPVISTTNSMLVRFRSDVSFQGHGFNLQYSTICTNTLTGFRGVIESPNFPNDYPQDQNCVWDITVNEGNKINISFSDFALERSTTFENKSCAFDYVEIEYIPKTPYAINSDGENTWVKKDRYCGFKNPGFITLDSNMARIHFVSDSLLLGSGFRLEWRLFGCGGILTDTTGIIESPNYPNPYPESIECNWLITEPLGQSVNITFDEISVEKDSSCASDYIQIFNGKDETYQQIATLCHNIKPIIITSSGNQMFIKFKADYSYEGRGFRAIYEGTPTTCGGLFTAPSGYIFSPNYPKNFNKNETCEWLIDIDQNHIIELKFEDVDLIRSADCLRNYIKVYDGPTQAYPVLKTICGNTSAQNETIRSTFEQMLVEFRSDYYLTSKGFKAQYRKSCGAKIKTSGSGQIKLTKEDDFKYYDENYSPITCTYTIEAEDKTKHVTLTITKLDPGLVWCESPTLKIYNGPFNDSPLIGDFCTTKVPPSITSDGSALHIEIHKELDFFATYSVLDSQCGGDLQSTEGYLATPGWPKKYPNDAQCTWTIAIGPGNTVHLNFLEFNIPESDSCNTDFLEIRETNAEGKLLGVFCGTNSPSNITTIGAVYLMFKSTRLEEGIGALKKGFHIEFATSTENKLFGSEGLIGNQFYPESNPHGTYGSYAWLITTNTSTIIEITFKDFSMEGKMDDCYTTSLKIYDGMDAESPLLKKLCGTDSPNSILSTSNTMYIVLDYYISRIEMKFLLKWKELVKANRKKPSKNAAKSACQYVYKLEGQSSVNLTSPGYPNGYAHSLQCEWVYEIPPQYHLIIKIHDLDLGTWIAYRTCTYFDAVKVYTKDKKNADWTFLKEFCNNSQNTETIEGSNLMKVEFRTNTYINGTGFRAEVFGVCGGALTEPSGVIEFDKDHNHGSECQWNITVRASRTIKLTFEQFDLNPNDPNNCRNYLIIRNGKFPDSPFLGSGRFCGQEVPPDMQSTSNHLYLKYTGTSSIKGFKVRYSEVSIECGQDFRLSTDETSVQIASPNYPNIPQAHSECIWIIRAPPGEALRIDFEERFDISQYHECITDYLELRDGGTEISPLIGRFCYETPGTKYSTDNLLRIKYFTDSNEPRNGFKAKVSISYCGGTLRGGGIISTKDSHVIRADSNCTWYLKAPLGFYFALNFLVFKVAQQSTNCSAEGIGKVRIYQTSLIPAVANETDLDTLCGKINTTEIRSTTNEVIVNYLVKSELDEFVLNVTVIKEECGQTLVQETGIITSPGYPVMSHEKRYCFWRIKVPKGRRISIFVENVDIDPLSTYLLICQGYNNGPRIVYQKDIVDQKTYETSDNTAHILFLQELRSNRRGFKLYFTSNKPTVCAGDFNTTSGELHVPQTADPYLCEYMHTKVLKEETLAIKIIMQTNLTKLGLNKLCNLVTTGIRIFSLNNNPVGIICQDTNNRPLIYRSIYPTTVLMIRRNSNVSLNFTLSFNTYSCGGLIENDQGQISSPNFPNTPRNSFECAWKIEAESSSRIKLNFTSFDLGDDCDKSYVVIYNGDSALSPRVGIYCKNNKPQLIISQNNIVLIEYRYEKSGSNPSKGFKLQYEPEIHGCGGIYHNKNTIIQTPNYGKDYSNNAECIWDIKADEGYMIVLRFFDRFYIEDSVNCTKDYVEIFDWNDDIWVSLGKQCGRNSPKTITSSNNQLRVIFRSDEKITGNGFRATWDWQCGGVFEAIQKDRYIMSPGFKSLNQIHSVLNCTYKIISKRVEGIINVKFLYMNLGTGVNSPCNRNITISVVQLGRLPHAAKQVYCGNDIPPIQRYQHTVIITYMNTPSYNGWTSGFKLVYQDEFCGGNITAPTVLESPNNGASKLPRLVRFGQPKISCTWYITAPRGQIAVLSIHNLSIDTRMFLCTGHSLQIFDGLEPKQIKKLAEICGNIEESRPIPSSSNTMLVKLQATAFAFNSFQGEVYFTYGPSVGCGGSINLTETTHISSPNNLPHMDCHWVIIAPRDYKIQLEFSNISVSASCENPVRNHTYYCTCSYIQVRDGGGPFSDEIIKLCSADNNSKRTLTTSLNKAYIRLYSAVPQTAMFKLTLKPVESRCGSSQLTATEQMQVLTSPDYPNHYPEGIKCMWMITGSVKFMIQFEDFNITNYSSDICDGDRLELTENHNQFTITEGLGPNARYQLSSTYTNSLETFKYAFCDNETKPFDYYTSGTEVILTFTSLPQSERKGRGFKLKYGRSVCNRTIYANEEMIQSDLHNSPNCAITIIAAPNRTISIHFLTFYYFYNVDPSCSTTGMEIRENNSTGPQIFKACGSRLPDPIFSGSNQLYIRAYHATQSSSFFFKYELQYTSSQNGKGCGGKLFNLKGKLSSPMYPNPYRKDLKCMWEVMVPKGYKVALKFLDFNIDGECLQNNVVITTYTDAAVTRHNFCPEDPPAVIFSNNVLNITYSSSITNGGNGWLAEFQAVKTEKDVFWF